MARFYEVLFYNGWQHVPAYYMVGGVEGRTPKEALSRHLSRVLSEVREQFSLGPDVEDDDICESLYALKSDGLVSASLVLPP